MNHPPLFKYKYTQNHLWLMQHKNYVFIGITDFAQREIGKIHLIEINIEGTIISRDSYLGYVEGINGKILELFMPFSGKLIKRNPKLIQNPEEVNSSPYKSWIASFELIEVKEEINSWMNPKEYKKTINRKTLNIT